eukprot:scaffold261742_cov31-Tisochrysis_lutea.AAC.2
MAEVARMPRAEWSQARVSHGLGSLPCNASRLLYHLSAGLMIMHGIFTRSLATSCVLRQITLERIFEREPELERAAGQCGRAVAGCGVHRALVENDHVSQLEFRRNKVC